MAAPAIVKAPVTRRTNTTLNPTSHRRGPNAWEKSDLELPFRRTVHPLSSTQLE